MFDISDMTLFTGVQHVCTFSTVAPVIYHLLPNGWKASYTISASIFVDAPYWPSYGRDKFISCVVLDLSLWLFHFVEEIAIAWTHIGWVRWIFQNLPMPAALEVREQKQRCDSLHCHEQSQVFLVLAINAKCVWKLWEQIITFFMSFTSEKCLILSRILAIYFYISAKF